MIQTIRVTSKNDTDPKGQSLLAEIKSTLNINSIKNVRTAKVYRLEGISEKDTQKLIESALVEPVDQKFTVNKKIFNASSQSVEVAYKPGVMNPEVASILKVASDLNIKLAAADSSFEYAFFGKLSKLQLQEIISRFLVNETVEYIVTKKPKTLLISGRTPKVQIIPIRKLSDRKLLDLSTNRLFLNLDEMKVIQNYFKGENRDPTDCEIEVLAQTWSEHCVHKTFKANLIIDGQKKTPFFDRIKSTAKNNKKIIVSAFDDNSGVIDFYDGWAINGKGETHNSPSAIEPYGGAMTGSGGVFRDIAATGQGAKVIASTDIFCFAPPNLPSNKIPPGCLPPTYLLKKVVAGVRDYGNRVGIPTNNGSVHFHEDFRAKPTVAVGSYGIIPKKNAIKKSPKVGDLILTIGGATGRDGIHGATFASGEMTHETGEVLGSSVQIGNAIEEKRIIDVVIALRNKNLIRSVTDCGGGGYSSAIGEMGESVGARVYLEKAPLKYSGLAPWEIFLSESQERLILAIDPKNLKKVQKICNLYNVSDSVLGKFNGSKRLVVTYLPAGRHGKNQTVCNMPMEFIHGGLPQRNMVGKSKTVNIKEKLPGKPKDLLSIFLKILANPNVASKEPIVRQYDHNVQGSTALHPFGGENFDAPNDAVVLRPILAKKYGFVTAHGLNPVLNKIDPYLGSVWAIAEAVSNYVAVGGDLKDAALIDNFIWPFPDEESLADLDKSVEACVDVAKILKMPFVSGKDSLSSTYRYPDSPLPAKIRRRKASGKVLKIPPVLLISVFGKIPDVTKTASSDFKKSGSTIVLVGKSDFKNLGGSTYFDITGSSGSNIPKIDFKYLPKTLPAITHAIQSGQILSCHDVSEGGMATTLFEMCLGGNCGAQIDLSIFYKGFSFVKKSENTSEVKLRSDFILFSETAGTFLVEVEHEKTAKKLFKGVPYAIIGKTITDKSVRVNQKSKTIINVSVEKLKEAWQKPMKEIFR
ncbi:MAG: Phosphoribosylformylglycinamidine synthase 2 [Candidatus Curtissbacteria bacterium GW2011_GWA1_41_11]|uniref:Phosphoribosylformylglycinamidine synthase subunit PurL n=1 Tax=Candidatus Curtissbacteria bacterium GW2011_GWA1_41_11 TaxID=1618409 RepID=A0A0G0WTD4_9BACT|nr:MAG: Phosphoribosylformylglycinamidine synthase 2 [Candidatus Curtissbacteria bacterium GW2011_GWA1_41_11]